MPESPKKVKKNRTPKGTKPNKSFDGPWKSLEQYQKFYRALVKALPIVANSHSPEGLANKIIGQLKKGELHSYWDDFINGLPIGTSTQHEWEVEPGVPHPMFIEYLAEKLIQGNNSQTREQAIDKALDIANSPKRAMFFWKECKISLGNALYEAERHRDLGVNALSTPLWTKERPEPTLEEAANAGNKIQQINGSTKAAIEATKNRQIEGSMGEVERLLLQLKIPLLNQILGWMKMNRSRSRRSQRYLILLVKNLKACYLKDLVKLKLNLNLKNATLSPMTGDDSR